MAGGVHWYDASTGFLMAAPPHRAIRVSDDDLAPLWRQWRHVGVRYASPLDGPGKLSYQLACSNAKYGLEGLSANTRSKIRRGLKRCKIENVPLSEIRTSGRQAHADTVSRQGRDGSFGDDRWDRFFTAAEDAVGFEGWVARVDGETAAFLVTVTFEDAVEFLLARSCNDRLGAYPNNALIFSVSEEMLVQRKCPEITFGLESLEPVDQLDQFKFSMGYEAKPIRQCIRFHPMIATAFRVPPLRSMVRSLVESQGSRGVAWRKAAGILRFAEGPLS